MAYLTPNSTPEHTGTGRNQSNVRRRQLHIWITERDHSFLRHAATHREISVGALLRRAIREMRRRVQQRAGASGAIDPGVETSGSGSFRREDPILRDR